VQRDLLQQQLRQAERLESLGRLAGGIAHDFNNLLAVILGHTESALAELPADSPHRPGLELIDRLAQRGAGLTRQLLVFGRQGPLRPETLDANEVVADTERVLRGAIGEDVEFVTRLGKDLWPVTIDRGELERLLLNLVSNSRRAMPYGGRLVIETRNLGPADASDRTAAVQARSGRAAAGADAGAPGGVVRLSVTDTGVGMPEHVRKHAFEPFFTTDSTAGTGLGLSSAYGVVRAAGGEISLASEPGDGTTVHIELPAARGRVPEPPEPEPSPVRGRGQTLVVVEDDDAVRDMVEMMLRRNGYHTVAVGSPVDAVGLFEQPDQPIDALVTDMVMAGMSGLELAEAARARRPGLPVLLMSGYSAAALNGDGVPPDGMSLLRKPFSTVALLRALDEALGG